MVRPPLHCSQRLNIQQLHSSGDPFGSFAPGMSSSVRQTEADNFPLTSGSTILNKEMLSFQYRPVLHLAHGKAKHHMILIKSYSFFSNALQGVNAEHSEIHDSSIQLLDDALTQTAMIEFPSGYSTDHVIEFSLKATVKLPFPTNDGSAITWNNWISPTTLHWTRLEFFGPKNLSINYSTSQLSGISSLQIWQLRIYTPSQNL